MAPREFSLAVRQHVCSRTATKTDARAPASSTPVAPRGIIAELASATARCTKTVRFHVGLRAALMPVARALRDNVCRAGPQPLMDWSMVRLGARAGPSLLSGPVPSACLHLRTSTVLSLAGYVAKCKTRRTTGLVQRQVQGRGQIVPLARTAGREHVGHDAVAHGFLRSADPRDHCGPLPLRGCVRDPGRDSTKNCGDFVCDEPANNHNYQINTITPIQGKAAISSRGFLRLVNGHASARCHSESSVVLRPSVDKRSLQNVILDRCFRAFDNRRLLKRGNTVFGRYRFPRHTGRLHLEDSPLFRPTRRQDYGSVAGGVSDFRPVVGIVGSPLLAKHPLWGHTIFPLSFKNSGVFAWSKPAKIGILNIAEVFVQNEPAQIIPQIHTFTFTIRALPSHARICINIECCLQPHCSNLRLFDFAPPLSRGRKHSAASLPTSLSLLVCWG